MKKNQYSFRMAKCVDIVVMIKEGAHIGILAKKIIMADNIADGMTGIIILVKGKVVYRINNFRLINVKLN